MSSKWQNEGYTLRFLDPVEDSYWVYNSQKSEDEKHICGYDWTVLAYDKNGIKVGEYSFYEWVKPHPEYGQFLGVNSAQTESDHQRKGLASEAYRLIEEKTGIKILKSPGNQSADAKALWKSREQKQ